MYAANGTLSIGGLDWTGLDWSVPQLVISLLIANGYFDSRAGRVNQQTEIEFKTISEKYENQAAEKERERARQMKTDLMRSVDPSILPWRHQKLPLI